MDCISVDTYKSKHRFLRESIRTDGLFHMASMGLFFNKVVIISTWYPRAPTRYGEEIKRSRNVEGGWYEQVDIESV